jgi:putative oxidoreductase
VQESPAGDYAGPMGVGEPPSWEKAAMDVVMGHVLILCGGSPLCLDSLLLKDLLRVWLA